MKLVLSAGSLHTLPLATIFELARESGFDGVEIIINQDFRFSSGVELVRQLQEIHPVCALHAPFFPVDGWGDQVQQLKRSVHLAAETGVPLVTFHPPAWLGMELGFWLWMKKIADFQTEIGLGRVTVAIENMPATGPFGVNPYFLSGSRQLIDFLLRHNLCLTFDTAHLGSTKADFLHEFHQLYNSGKMRNIHFSDYANGREHLLPGHGGLPLTRFLNHLRETGYDQTLVLELAPREFPAEMERIRESLVELHAYLAKETRADQPAVRSKPGAPDLRLVRGGDSEANAS